jgi:glutamate decarboxylase
MAHHRRHHGEPPDSVHTPTYSDRYFVQDVPKRRLPDGPMPADAAYRLISDELNLDGNPALNLASFVTTWMEPEAQRLAADTAAKNLVDGEEYPMSQLIADRVVSIIARLFGAEPAPKHTGTVTAGSSEAIMLALLAHKESWRQRRAAAGKPLDRPNVVIGADVHTCWEKFTRYFDVEAKIAPMTHDCYFLTADDVKPLLDENTIAVGAVVGTTFTGQIDAVADIDAMLTEGGHDIPIHVDAASGGFVVPFTDPDLKWDFRLPNVRSINVSNHKFGLVYPGMGTVVFRDAADLPEELVFKITYLGGEMDNYSLNFSRPATPVVLQYYNFLRLGHEGYRRVVHNVMANARLLEERMTATGRFRLLTDTRHLPVVCVTNADGNDLDLRAVSGELRSRGWIIPAYPLPANAEGVTVLRAVVRENVSRDMVETLSEDLQHAIEAVDDRAPGRRAAQHERPHPPC